jgi:hypothetical protein
MAIVNDHNTQVDAVGGKVVFHQLAPAGLFRGGNLGKTIAGQVYQVALLINDKVIDMDGFTGLFANTGEILPLQQTIDDRGFTDVGFSGERNLRQVVFGEILIKQCDLMKIGC